MAESNRAVVVGAGPNGLVGALTLARAGLEVTVIDNQRTAGGGVRTESLGLATGITHDLCSAIHPLAVSSPIFKEIDLESLGVEFITPEISYAQPLADSAALAYRDLTQTVEHLGTDGRNWANLLRPLVENSHTIIDLIVGDRARALHTGLAPRNLRASLKFAIRILEQGSRMWNRRFAGESAPALLTGVAAHAMAPLPSIGASGTALLLAMLGHSHGWPIPRGGSGAITAALLAKLARYKVRFEYGHAITSRHQLPPAQLYLFDTTPQVLATIWADQLPAPIARAMRKYRYGPGAAKLDLVVNAPIPWATPELTLAATVHVGGTRAQMARAESLIHQGKMPQWPMVLVSEPANHDPSRQVGQLRPVWAYAHVPHGYSDDVSAQIIAHIERYAPGFTDTIVAHHATPASQMSGHSLNYIGGDIAAGAINIRGILARPRLAANPYRTGIPGVYLCSSATPPGPGVHGMSGFLAAQTALKNMRR